MTFASLKQETNLKKLRQKKKTYKAGHCYLGVSSDKEGMYLEWINFHLGSCLSAETGTSVIQVVMQEGLYFTATLAEDNGFLLT